MNNNRQQIQFLQKKLSESEKIGDIQADVFNKTLISVVKKLSQKN